MTRSNLPLASSCNWFVTAVSASDTAVGAAAAAGAGADSVAGGCSVEAAAAGGVLTVPVVGTSSPPDAACGFGAGTSAAGDAGAGAVAAAGGAGWAADSSGFAAARSGAAVAGPASMLMPAFGSASAPPAEIKDTRAVDARNRVRRTAGIAISPGQPASSRSQKALTRIESDRPQTP